MNIYLLGFILSVFTLGAMVFLTKKQENTTFIMLFCTVVIVNFGYMELSEATTVKEAILANKVTYFDGCFLTLFLFLSVLKLCHIELSTLTQLIMITVSFVIFGFAMTVGKNGLYYKSVDIDKYKGYTYLIKTYGPVHNFYYVLLAVYMLAPVAVIIFSAFHRERVSYIHTFCLGMGEVAAIAVYLIEQALSIKIELLPFAYLFGELMIIIVAARTRKYDISQNISMAHQRNQEIGYIVFDKNGKYIASDKVARKYFPELEGLLIDLPVTNEFVKENFVDWTFNYFEGENDIKYFYRNDKALKVTLKPIYRDVKDRLDAYMIEIMDDTRQQKHINELSNLNEQLSISAREADMANRSKSAFLANMSHEIRTPINAILGMDAMILRETKENAIVEYAENIKEAGDNLLSLVNDILDFSKIESGKMEIVCDNYNTREMLDRCYGMIYIRTINKNLKFIVDVDRNLPETLYGDGPRIHQIMINLLTNAVKYTKKGTVKLSVSQKIVDEQNIKLVISVMDTGIGIRKEDQEKLFESFRRIDEKRNMGIEGTGLGMAITVQLLNLMNGTISVESEYEKGSCFTAIIPQKRASEDTIGEYKPGEKKAVTTVYKESFHAPDAKILVVDDVDMNLRVFKALLKKTEIGIDMAHSGAECLDKIKQKKYDIIFLDHMMPEMDGIETLNHMKLDKEHKNQDTPVIVLTANAIVGAKEEYLNAGFDDYLSKPVVGADLERMIMNYLQ